MHRSIVQGPITSHRPSGAHAGASDSVETVERGFNTFFDPKCPSNALLNNNEIPLSDLKARAQHYFEDVRAVIKTQCSVCAIILEETHSPGKWNMPPEILDEVRIVVVIEWNSRCLSGVAGAVYPGSQRTKSERQQIRHTASIDENFVPEYFYTLPPDNFGFESAGIIMDADANRILSNARVRDMVAFCPFKIAEGQVNWPRALPLFVYAALFSSYSGKLRHFGPCQVLVDQLVLLSTPYIHGPACFCYAVSCAIRPCPALKGKRLLIAMRDDWILLMSEVAGTVA